jgi:hypothetical protein
MSRVSCYHVPTPSLRHPQFPTSGGAKISTCADANAHYHTYLTLYHGFLHLTVYRDLVVGHRVYKYKI